MFLDLYLVSVVYSWYQLGKKDVATWLLVKEFGIFAIGKT